MKIIIMLVALAALTACTRGPTTDRTGMAADAITTGMAVADTRLMEANPFLSGLNNMNPVAAAAVGFGVKVGVEKGIDYMVRDDPRFEPDFAKVAMNAAGTGAACWNAGMLAGAAASPPLALGALACAFVDWQWRHFAFSYPWDKPKT